MSSRLKIVTVGPFPPLRGGISDFHDSLVKQLSKSSDVTVLNFKSLYPKIFFPGKSQYGSNQSSFKNVYTILGPLNIISWIKGRFFLKKNNPDKLIVSYWNFFFIPLYIFLLGSVRKGNRYVLFHNVFSHERKIFESLFLKYFLNKIDYCIVMNNHNKKLIQTINSKVKIINNLHPIYDIPKSNTPNNIHKKDLKIEGKKTILFFGLIREYKGLDLLIKSIQLSKEKVDNLKVLVVGESYQSLKPYHRMIKELGIEDHFIFINRFIAKSSIEKYFLSSDLVVLPYKSASQSGILSLAYNFNRPVIVTDVGGLSEYVSNERSGFIVEPNPKNISDKINIFFNSNLFSEMSNFIQDHKEKFSWKLFEERLNLYE